MIAAAARTPRHEPSRPWQWPIDVSAYDQRPQLMRREAAALARRAAYPLCSANIPSDTKLARARQPLRLSVLKT